MSEFVTVQSKTARARSALFVLKTEIDAIAATVPERSAQMAVTRAQATDDWQNRTGKTRKSIRAKQVSAYRWRFVAGGASLWLNDGTGIYGPRGTPIVPVHATALRFKIGGHWISTKSVKGIKPTHFVDKARDDAEAFFMTEMAQQLNAVIAAHNR